jgi:hypothetical protein
MTPAAVSPGTIQYLQLNFNGTFSSVTAVIFNRRDGAAFIPDVNNLTVYLSATASDFSSSGTVCASGILYDGQGQNRSAPCPPTAQGSFLTITKEQKTNYLSPAEVQITGACS